MLIVTLQRGTSEESKRPSTKRSVCHLQEEGSLEKRVPLSDRKEIEGSGKGNRELMGNWGIYPGRSTN